MIVGVRVEEFYMGEERDRAGLSHVLEALGREGLVQLCPLCEG